MDQLSSGLPIREFLLVGLVSGGVTLLLTGPVRMLALKAGAVAWPRGRDVHVTPTPRWGGLAMFGGVLAGLVLALQLPALRLAYFEGSTEVIGVVVATALLVGVGLLDDRYDLDAVTKFAAQVTAGGLLVLYGVQWMMIWIPLGGGGTGISGSLLSLGQGQGVLLTVLLTVGLVNAMNFVDGLDGLAAGIGLIATLATAVFCIGLISENGNDPAAFTPALIAVVLAGACLGFLPHNFNPARIFMGDTGSMLVGVMLSAAVTSASGKLTYSDETSGTDLLALIAPILVVIGIVFIPTLDLLLAIVRRTRAGTSPFSPDKMHLHHRLLQVGHSHRRAVLLAYLWVAVIAFGAVALALVPQTWLVLAATAVALIIAFVASAVPHRSRRRAAAAAAPVAAADDVPASGASAPGTAAPGTAAPGTPGPRRETPGPGGPDRSAQRPAPDVGTPPHHPAGAPGRAGDAAPQRPGGPPGPPGSGNGATPHRPGGAPVPGSAGAAHRPAPPVPGNGAMPHRPGDSPVPGNGAMPRPPQEAPDPGLARAPHRPGPPPGNGVPPRRPADPPPHRPGETPVPGGAEPPRRPPGRVPTSAGPPPPVPTPDAVLPGHHGAPAGSVRSRDPGSITADGTPVHPDAGLHTPPDPAPDAVAPRGADEHPRRRGAEQPTVPTAPPPGPRDDSGS
ncbi:hypothetical protein [Pseudonocardia ammonioxydans]|uniref:hypothetical protein n=1 Tax=Pseudonocardia ammonioxydans TaxID=260086 RepID=UPI003183EB9F